MNCLICDRLMVDDIDVDYKYCHCNCLATRYYFCFAEVSLKNKLYNIYFHSKNYLTYSLYCDYENNYIKLYKYGLEIYKENQNIPFDDLKNYLEKLIKNLQFI